MQLHPQEVKGRYRVIGHDHYGHSFLLYHTDIEVVAQDEYQKELALDPPRYPGIDLIEIHEHAEVANIQ